MEKLILYAKNKFEKRNNEEKLESSFKKCFENIQMF
jgi:hypothetical protein